jgi:two-component system, chemotaxis family, response regulator Rcp1
MLPLSLPWPTVFSGDCCVPAHTPNVPVELLLVEDSPNDAELMVEALEESELVFRVTVIEDGEEALDYLHQVALRPDLILLDLHLPRKSGHEILAELDQDENLRAIPVIVLTSFDPEPAIGGVLDLHAGCCVRKPSDLEQFARTVQTIESFWLHHARLQPVSHDTPDPWYFAEN